MDDSIKLKLTDFKQNVFKSRNYWILCIILIVLASLTMFNAVNYAHPKFEIIALILVSLISIFAIAHYYKHGNEELYKTVFIVLLLFGLICAFMIPIDSVSDEYEHLSRAEITSRGIFVPEYNNGSYEVAASLPDFYKNATDKTVFEVSGDTLKIDNSMESVNSAFEQNPFYGYLFSAIGIALAKLLDLNVIWMLWLGRIFNVIVYAGLISFAVKKSPIFKIQLFAISCLPVCLFQAFSISIDSLMAGLGILAIAYFFNMCVNKFDKKEIAVFTALCLLTALCKIPYLALVFLLLFVPKDNFKENNYYLYAVIAVICVSVIGLVWNSCYATPALSHSWRGQYFIENNVSVSGQLNYISSHPYDFLGTIPQLISNTIQIFSGFFNFYAYTIDGGEYCGSELVSVFLTLFVLLIAFYPSDYKIDLKTKIGAIIVFIIIYVGTFYVQLLSWSPVGQMVFNGVHTRYFLPLFALLPFIFTIFYQDENSKELDKYTIVFIILFMSAMVMSFAAKFY